MVDKANELIEKMYIEFSEKFETIENDIQELKNDVKQINAAVNHDIRAKINVLFDGHIQQVQQLERIEKEVSIHEEIILRRIE